jgi:hypothetical protein
MHKEENKGRWVRDKKTFTGWVKIFFRKGGGDIFIQNPVGHCRIINA